MNEQHLGEGCYLIPLEVEDNRNRYSYLYKDGVKLSDMVFRKGGMGGKYNDEYCKLISYPDFVLKEGGNQKSSIGIWCIVDLDGNIVLSEKGHFSYDITHVKGIVAKLREEIYNLKTGEIIACASASSSIETDQYLWVKHAYNYASEGIRAKWGLGVYRIDCYTGEVEFYPDKIKQPKVINISFDSKFINMESIEQKKTIKE